MTTDPRTRQPYPPDGTVVAALFYGSAHWHTGPVRWDDETRMHEIDSPGLGGHLGDSLEQAAHWYEVGHV